MMNRVKYRTHCQSFCFLLRKEEQLRKLEVEIDQERRMTEGLVSDMVRLPHFTSILIL